VCEIKKGPSGLTEGPFSF